MTLAGNPVLSTPNSDRLARALDELDFMVSVDLYLNETTRHADVILPPPVAARSVGTTTCCCCSSPSATSPTTRRPCCRSTTGQPDEWEIIARLAAIAQGLGTDVDASVARRRRHRRARQGCGDKASIRSSRVAMRTSSSPSCRRRAVAGPSGCSTSCCGPARSVTGSARPRRASLDDLLTPPHGVTSVRSTPRIPEMLRTPSGTDRTGAPAVDRRPPAACSGRSTDWPAAAGARRPAPPALATTRGCTT